MYKIEKQFSAPKTKRRCSPTRNPKNVFKLERLKMFLKLKQFVKF